MVTVWPVYGLAWIFVTMATTATASPPVSGEALFEGHVRPLLVDRCQKCHGDEKSESGLRLDSLAALLQGGDSGPTIVPGDPKNSLLVTVLKHGGDVEMPPDTFLPDDQIAVVERWIEAGAPWPSEGGSAVPRTTPFRRADGRRAEPLVLPAAR